MILKWIGALFVFCGCGSVGFRIAANYRQEEHALRQLICILDYMECELQYRHTSLPELCRQGAAEFTGKLGMVFSELAKELEMQTSSNIEGCMENSLDRVRGIPPITCEKMKLLGKSIGKFDLDGQLKGLETVRQECRRKLNDLGNNRENRIRSYQTLGLCAGAALAIIFV